CGPPRGVVAPRRLAPSAAMATDIRVCPFCGEPPGEGVFCAACGRNLAAVERLPTREEWGAGREDPAPGRDGPGVGGDDPVGVFLHAMRAVGCPGTKKLPIPGAKKKGIFGRTPDATVWVVRPVAWDDADNPRHHEPGLVLTTDGAFHVLES